MKKSIGIRFVYALLIAAFAFGAFAAPSAKAAQDPGTIVDVALAANAATGEFSILIAALQAANPDILKKLSGDREYTVFAPTDAAFTALLTELGVTAEQLLSDKPMLSRVLRYHIAAVNWKPQKSWQVTASALCRVDASGRRAAF